MKQLLILLFVIILFTDCNNNKSWSAGEKQQSLKLCMDEVEGKLGDNEAKKFCSCLMEKAMRNYPSYEAADKAITDEQGKKMGQACIKELGIGGGNMGGDEEGMGGDREKKKDGLFDGGDGDEDNINDGGATSGGWSKSDRNAFISPCKEGLAGDGYSSAQARQLCDCVLGRLEKKYSSLKEANERGGEAAGSRARQECEADRGQDDNDDEN